MLAHKLGWPAKVPLSHLNAGKAKEVRERPTAPPLQCSPFAFTRPPSSTRPVPSPATRPARAAAPPPEQDLIDELEPEILADPEVLSILRERNKYDLRLYDFAAEQWRQDRHEALTMEKGGEGGGGAGARRR